MPPHPPVSILKPFSFSFLVSCPHTGGPSSGLWWPLGASFCTLVSLVPKLTNPVSPFSGTPGARWEFFIVLPPRKWEWHSQVDSCPGGVFVVILLVTPPL